MKVTIELPDALVEQVERLTREEGLTLPDLVEEGLQRCLVARLPAVKASFTFPTWGDGRMSPEFEGAEWSAIRDEIYRYRH